MRLTASLGIIFAASVNAAVDADELGIAFFDGGWSRSDSTFECATSGTVYRMEVTDGNARVFVDNDYKAPVHITYSPEGVVYLYGTTEQGTGVMVDFETNTLVTRDYGRPQDGILSELRVASCD